MKKSGFVLRFVVVLFFTVGLTVLSMIQPTFNGESNVFAKFIDPGDKILDRDNWQIVSKYFLTFDGNGNTTGTVPPQQRLAEGDTMTVPEPGSLERECYYFFSWNTSQDGSGTRYAPGETFTMGSGNVTLYAQWMRPLILQYFGVNYDGNGHTGGTAPSDREKYTLGQNVAVMDQGTLEKDCFTFIGWNTKTDGSGKGYTAGSNMVMGCDHIKLYAQWEGNKYSITYYGNGNTGGAVPVDANSGTYQQGYLLNVLANTGELVKEGYTFTGWNSKSDGSGTPYPPGSTLTMACSDVILYAQWTKNDVPLYSVTYDGNGQTSGSVPSAGNSPKYEEGAMVIVLGNTGGLVKEGYNFTGWNTKSDGSGESYSAGFTFSMGKSDMVLYAQWVEVAVPLYTVTYDGNGNDSGTVSASGNNQKFKEGAVVQVLRNTESLAKEGYEFVGWNTKPDGSGTSYLEGTTFTMGNANITLYASWKKEANLLLPIIGAVAVGAVIGGLVFSKFRKSGS